MSHAPKGSIPAHAGQPTSRHKEATMSRVHPRSRGAAVAGFRICRPNLGPSPLTRGSLPADPAAAPSVGSIPAHAGQPKLMGRCGRWLRVHPRSRGAALITDDRGPLPAGPSPLTRGSLDLQDVAPGVMGSIPAHAGQPHRASFSRTLRGVHPRSRGAATTPRTSGSRARGPSPLTRGSPFSRAPAGADPGSIPAHAGQPPSSLTALPGKRVHPRSRGAATNLGPAAGYIVGPSPLTRGSRFHRHPKRRRSRSIPAHAGQP